MAGFARRIRGVAANVFVSVDVMRADNRFKMHSHLLSSRDPVGEDSRTASNFYHYFVIWVYTMSDCLLNRQSSRSSFWPPSECDRDCLSALFCLYCCQRLLTHWDFSFVFFICLPNLFFLKDELWKKIPMVQNVIVLMCYSGCLRLFFIRSSGQILFCLIFDRRDTAKANGYQILFNYLLLRDAYLIFDRINKINSHSVIERKGESYY